MLPFFRNRPPATIVLEACGSAHYWARELQAMGHRPVLLPPHATRAYVPRNKTDRTDAKGLLEAIRNRDLRAVPVKSVLQQTLSAMHRLRSGWMAERTARINSIRGILREFGFVLPVGARYVVRRTTALLADPDVALPDAVRPVLFAAVEEIRQLEVRRDEAEVQLTTLATQLPVVGRLQTIPGIGLITSTALVAAVGDVERFPTCRHFASYLGLAPREWSSGATRRLGGISKRGDTYLRSLLIHGARAVLWAARRRAPDRLRTWALEMKRRHGQNKAAVALANKLARIVWSVWRHEVDFAERPIV
jgi:transposase